MCHNVMCIECRKRFAGPFGINHGIEMHGDVIKYAYNKLNDFKKHSPALDSFEFCDPVFVKGTFCLKHPFKDLK